MKYSIKKSRHSYIMFTYEKGIQAYRSTPVELEFWKRIQELEAENKGLRAKINPSEDEETHKEKILDKVLNEARYQ